MKQNALYILLLLLLLADRSLAVEGAPGICVGQYDWYGPTSGAAGGSWSSSNTSVATIEAGTGKALGIAAGTTTISYTSTSGTETLVVTVTPFPPHIAGDTATVILGSTLTLTNAVAGGTWSSNNTAVATVGSSTGIVMAVGIGDARIDYNVPGCGRDFGVFVRFPAGIENLTQSSHIVMYPNPANGMVNINWGASAGTGVVTICDVLGHTVYATQIDMREANGKKLLDLTGMPDGLYIMRISSPSVYYNSKLEISR